MSNTPSWTAGHSGSHEVSGRAFAHRQSKMLSVTRENPDSGRMGWSWKLGRFAGIDVYIHATFLVLIGWLVLMYLGRGATPGETAQHVLLILALFGCVVLHEYGHALTARRYGVATRDITLLPIGGIARLERIPKEPYQELVVALAGPAVNVIIAGFLWVYLWFSGQSVYEAFNAEHMMSGTYPALDLFRINLMLAAFNMLPAFPMDGGRVLRALLSMKISRVKATRIASVLGRAMAVLFGIMGLMGNPFLLIIALFVYMGASQEYQASRWEAAVEGLSAKDALVTNFRTLLTTDPLTRAVSLLLEGSQHDFPVLDEQFRVVGLLLRQDLIAALSREGGNRTVASAMRPVTVSATPDDPLEQVFERMQVAQLPVLPVFDSQSGKLTGLLTMENVAEVVMVRNALEKAQVEAR